MKIVRLESSNVKRIKAITITPEGNVVRVSGNNAQGKTSVLDSIEYALGGKSTHPPEVIRRGEKDARVLVDLGDIVVERRWTSNERSVLSVKGRDGASYGSPQAMLDKLVGRLSFDPLAFMRLPARSQADAVRELLGLDFTAMERERAELYAQRTDINRDATRLEASLVMLPAVDAPDEPESVDALLAELADRQAKVAEQNAVRAALTEAQASWNVAALELKARRERVADLEAQLAAAQQRVAEKQTDIATLTTEGKRLKAAVEGLPAIDLEEVNARLRNIEATNARVRARHQRAQEEARLEEARAASADLTAQIDALDAQKARALAEAAFPVEGLGFTPDGLTFRGLPISQASSAEQLRVSLAMGLALNPTLRVVLIRDGSLLDASSLGMVARMAQEAGAQVWLEMVGTEGEAGVVIEDGEVAS